MKFASLWLAGAAGLAVSVSATPIPLPPNCEATEYGIRCDLSGARFVEPPPPAAWIFPVEVPEKAEAVEHTRPHHHQHSADDWMALTTPDTGKQGGKKAGKKGGKKGERKGEKVHGGCRKTLAAKFNGVANEFRKFMGMPEIEAFHPPHHRPAPPMFADVVGSPLREKVVVGEPLYHALPFVEMVEAIDTSMDAPPNHGEHKPWYDHVHPHHNKHGHHRGGHHGSFMQRMTHALFILGPVEGRIVAFVLGLGMGALIRVVYVFCLLGYRAARGRQQGRIFLVEDDAADVVVVREAEAEVREAAPAYTVVAPKSEEIVSEKN